MNGFEPAKACHAVSPTSSSELTIAILYLGSIGIQLAGRCSVNPYSHNDGMRVGARVSERVSDGQAARPSQRHQPSQRRRASPLVREFGGTYTLSALERRPSA